MKQTLRYILTGCLLLAAITGMAQSVQESVQLARIALQSNDYEQALTYLSDVPNIKKHADAFRLQQMCMDTINNRSKQWQMVADNQKTHLQFELALQSLDKISTRSDDYSTVTKLRSQYEKYLKLQQEGKIVSEQLKQAIQALPQDRVIHSFHSGWARVGWKDNRNPCFISKQGETIKPFAWDVAARDFTEGISIGYSDFGNTFLADSLGNTIALGHIVIYDDFSEGLCVAFGDKSKFFINKKGQKVLDNGFDYIDVFSEGRALVRKKKHYLYINKNGYSVIENVAPPTDCSGWSYLSQFSEGIAWIKADSKSISKLSTKLLLGGLAKNTEKAYAAIDHDGKTLFYIGEENIRPASQFSSGLACIKVVNNDQTYYGFISKTGEYVIDAVYEQAYAFSEGLAAVRKDGKWGFIDTKGEIAIPLEYDWVRDCSEGIMAVRKDNKWGFIDKTGKVLFPCFFHGADSFSEGLALVQLDGKYGFIDKYGFCTLDFTE